MDTNVKHFCVSEHIRDSSGEILRGNRTAGPGTVSQHKGVISPLADRHGIGKTFVEGADVGKAPTRGYYREGRSGFSTKEKQARV